DRQGGVFELRQVNAGHFQMYVEALEQRSGYTRAILRDLPRSTAAIPKRVAEASAGAGIHRGDELELGRILRVIRSAGYGYNAGFQRFPQGFQGAAVVFQ